MLVLKSALNKPYFKITSLNKVLDFSDDDKIT